jgi:hypothetical protein
MEIAMASLEAVREWLIAAGTLGATSVALYVGVLRDRRRRPNLSIEEFKPGDKADAQIVGMGPIGGSVHTKGGYARLRVYNEKGKDTAEEVQVLVERVRLGDGNEIRDSEYLGELPLAVSGSWPTETHLNLPPGLGRHFDCVHVRKDKSDPGDPVVFIDVHPVPADSREEIHAARFELDIAVTARNADARFYAVSVEFDGTWPDEEEKLFEHLRIRLSPR